MPGPAERSDSHAAREPLYRIIILNDDRTPMDFVVHVLITIFLMPDANAGFIMYTAHVTGHAYVQTLPRPEARRRINKACFAARLNGYPLDFSLQPE